MSPKCVSIEEKAFSVWLGLQMEALETRIRTVDMGK
jgi:hypothetical protein